ncbi:MAG: START-like domain-containing protein [Tunicatimonas sp.]
MNHPPYTAEFEFKASRKMLFPYINTPSGLSQWFADDVVVDEDKVFTFSWNSERARAQRVVQRANKLVRFEFLDESDPPSSDEVATDAVLEIRLEENDLTGAVFLSVTDSVSADNEEEFQALWNQMTDSLREIVGG